MRISHIIGLFPLGSVAVTFTSCTPAQVSTLEVAIDRATNKSYAAIEHLEANPTGSEIQTTWYGAFSTERYNRVLTAFKVSYVMFSRVCETRYEDGILRPMFHQKFAPDLATTFTYDCSCVSDAVIATIGGRYGDVRICSVYFNEAIVPPSGQHRNQWE